MREVNIENFYVVLNNLIKEKKITFDFYNSNLKLDLLEICYNNKSDSIEFKFRDTMKEHIDELRELNQILLEQKNIKK